MFLTDRERTVSWPVLKDNFNVDKGFLIENRRSSPLCDNAMIESGNDVWTNIPDSLEYVQ